MRNLCFGVVLFSFFLAGCGHTNHINTSNIPDDYYPGITPQQAEEIVLDKHKNNPDGKVVVTSVKHKNGQYKVSWKVDSKIVDHGTDIVSDTTGKILSRTQTIQ